MYLTIMEPEVLDEVAELGAGLWLLRIGEPPDIESVLVVKASKEMILTARERRSFSFYLAPCHLAGSKGFVLITAFFDNPTDPLVITSPLISGHPILTGLQGLPDTFKVCFFDDQNREQLSCQASSSLEMLRQALLTNAHFDAHQWERAWPYAHHWFASRSAQDDERAFTVSLIDDLFPSNTVFHEISDRHSFVGSPGFSSLALERTDPGPPQELDIIFLLQRIYPAERILHGPLKISDGEELADIVVLGETMNLLLQAKDSPNTDVMLKTNVDRKRRKASHKLSDGLSQLGGAISTVRREGVLAFKFESVATRVEVDFTQNPCLGVVIVKELFSKSYVEYSETVFSFVEKYELPVVFFDYLEFEEITRNCRSEAELLDFFDTILTRTVADGVYPRFYF
jgi:hypothetical protein